MLEMTHPFVCLGIEACSSSEPYFSGLADSLVGDIEILPGGRYKFSNKTGSYSLSGDEVTWRDGPLQGVVTHFKTEGRKKPALVIPRAENRARGNDLTVTSARCMRGSKRNLTCQGFGRQQHALQVFDFNKNLPDLVENSTACGSNADASGTAFEQLQTELMFQVADKSGGSWLANPEAASWRRNESQKEIFRVLRWGGRIRHSTGPALQSKLEDEERGGLDGGRRGDQRRKRIWNTIRDSHGCGQHSCLKTGYRRRVGSPLGGLGG